jgi:hypothetical protein
MSLDLRAEEIEKTIRDPYRNLLLAMIERAIMDALNQSKASSHSELRRLQEHKEDALEWLFSDKHEPLSFLGICEYLDYSAECIRAAIKKELA